MRKREQGSCNASGRYSEERHEGKKNMETQNGQRHGEDRG